MLKKRHNKSFKRHIMLFYFPFCFIGLVFWSMFKRIKYRTEIKQKKTDISFLIFSRKEINRKTEQLLKQKQFISFPIYNRKEIKTIKIERKLKQK